MSVAQGTNTEEAIAYLLNRVQRQLWVEFDWPIKRVKLSKTVTAGVRYSDYPTDMSYEGVIKVYAPNGTQWYPLVLGIDVGDYSIWNSDQGQVSSPVRKWEHHSETDQFELWPVPSIDTQLYFEGMMDCPKMVLQTDRCVLDDLLIVMRASAEIAVRQKLADAQIKLADAAKMAQKLLARQRSSKQAPFIYGGGINPTVSQRKPRPYIDFIP